MRLNLICCKCDIESGCNCPSFDICPIVGQICAQYSFMFYVPIQIGIIFYMLITFEPQLMKYVATYLICKEMFLMGNVMMMLFGTGNEKRNTITDCIFYFAWDLVAKGNKAFWKYFVVYLAYVVAGSVLVFLTNMTENVSFVKDFMFATIIIDYVYVSILFLSYLCFGCLRS